jgi:Fic family protein
MPVVQEVFKEERVFNEENETATRGVIRYELPTEWIKYDALALVKELSDAKAGVLSLTNIPYQRDWARELEQMQLKREVAGTSRIEGADFTERELDAALRESPEQLVTRSQKQARAALDTYKWIATLEDDRPVTPELINEIHRRIVTGADDDHCQPGAIRGRDQNVLFGAPRHRGCNGGEECATAFKALTKAAAREYSDHDPLIQALALHYHFAAMHPFQDGNGRTARAMEALMLRRAGLRDALFIAMSNFYYDNKDDYLKALSTVRAQNQDLTPFLKFGLRGIAVQCSRLFNEIKTQVQKALFRNVMYDLFDRLQSPRRRVIAQRQLDILRVFLRRERMDLSVLWSEVSRVYKPLKNGWKAFIRDINNLLEIEALDFEVEGEKETRKYRLWIKLDWATEITETAFFERAKNFPKAKTGFGLHG